MSLTSYLMALSPYIIILINKKSVLKECVDTPLLM